MRYASIRDMDISNGYGIGVALFTQGCHFHCKNCFNQSTWDFAGGKEFTQEVEEVFYSLVNRKYVTRVSLLGGEPLADENIGCISRLVKNIVKPIWVYTGNTFEVVAQNPKYGEILSHIDILVDGRYIDELKDLSLPFRGSLNQRVIDVQKSLMAGKVINYIL